MLWNYAFSLSDADTLDAMNAAFVALAETTWPKEVPRRAGNGAVAFEVHLRRDSSGALWGFGDGERGPRGQAAMTFIVHRLARVQPVQLHCVYRDAISDPFRLRLQSYAAPLGGQLASVPSPLADEYENVPEHPHEASYELLGGALDFTTERCGHKQLSLPRLHPERAVNDALLAAHGGFEKRSVGGRDALRVASLGGHQIVLLNSSQMEAFDAAWQVIGE